ncbi:MAG: molybdenum cofactor biosynthesis protein MoaE [Planctomycetota bacterium]|nr:molybdenum cofactor biosynthesis protein MoaE [Planctomycetota bacterium]
MRLSVRLFAVLRERAGTDEITLEGLPDQLDLAGLKECVARAHPELGDLSAVAGVIGDAYAADDTPLAEGDAVALLPPVSGGEPDEYEQGVFELSAEALDPAACQARVATADCGAVLLFTGTTRAHNRGQRVTRLDYEAFREMAGPEMKRIYAACRAQFGGGLAEADGPVRMLTVHRVGTVSVGEPSIVIAVASAHRDRAYAVSRFLIDRLKERLPLWKKEVYADGHHWIGDRS